MEIRRKAYQFRIQTKRKWNMFKNNVCYNLIEDKESNL